MLLNSFTYQGKLLNKNTHCGQPTILCSHMLDEFVQLPKRWLTKLQLTKLSQKFRHIGGGQNGSVSDDRFQWDGFVVHGWRWHHLGIVRDLRRLSASIQKRQTQLCPASAHQGPSKITPTSTARLQWVALKDMLDHILDDNWRLHDYVEEALFFPWLAKRLDSEHPRLYQPFLKDVALIASQRELLTRDAKALARSVSVTVNDGLEKIVRDGASCGRTVHAIRSKLDRLSKNADTLFEASEAAMIPRVIEAFSRAEQLRFNDKVISNLSGRQARISLVVFKHAVHDSPHDALHFQNGVPAPIRKIALPYWFKKFVAHKIRFVADPYPSPSHEPRIAQSRR